MSTTHLSNRIRDRRPIFNRECSVCHSKAIGLNFGVPTCAPCKAFFRRNARRSEILELPCQHNDMDVLNENNTTKNDPTFHYLQIRQCSSCRLRRCFDVGMKEALIRTEEENQRHRQLVYSNRQRREMLKQQEEQFLITGKIYNDDLVSKIDWCHLSNVVYAYDTYCVKTYVEQRENMFNDVLSATEKQVNLNGKLPMNITLSLITFLQALPAFQSLSRTNQQFLSRNNLRRLILINYYELNQACFSEPWQLAMYKSIWESICGAEIYKNFDYALTLAEKSIITDPIMTRIWIIILFFSTPLFSYYDQKTKAKIIKVRKNSLFIDIQNIYVNLLWKYLSYRHGPMESVRIYSNLVFAFIKMLNVGLDINMRLRTQKESAIIHETLDNLANLNINSY